MYDTVKRYENNVSFGEIIQDFTNEAVLGLLQTGQTGLNDAIMNAIAKYSVWRLESLGYPKTKKDNTIFKFIKSNMDDVDLINQWKITIVNEFVMHGSSGVERAFVIFTNILNAQISELK